ncbi:hypothetical protein [Microbacterium dauci]|uniref:Helix-turn-helix domain-containing protein n=1 Tax=Microbacterium dauci TaxID=3048008 RepID=A0ABT6ZCA8_9MICO|nr:hypothetical protein [Microbacterium sp. LX3-4]MDJ1113787.1 hypothetical protein [Microbacterium sp. LX3-4]
MVSATELEARMANPALFAAADDLVEAEMAKRAGTPANAPTWLTPEQVAERIPHLTVKRLAELRQRRQGPSYYRPTLRAVFYLETDIDALTIDAVESEWGDAA